jgi:hypothetical protein
MYISLLLKVLDLDIRLDDAEFDIQHLVACLFVEALGAFGVVLRSPRHRVVLLYVVGLGCGYGMRKINKSNV